VQAISPRRSARTLTLVRRAAGALIVATTLTCARSHGIFPPSSDMLSEGTWGGKDAGVLVNDVIAHVHVGCTYGDFPAPIPLGSDGRFSVAGSYLVQAYPIAVGPPLPAQFAGIVQGATLTYTVAVNDTVQHKLVVLGPSTVRYGREPDMVNCPICAVPPSAVTRSLLAGVVRQAVRQAGAAARDRSPARTHAPSATDPTPRGAAPRSAVPRGAPTP
jgi:hypothetical protein